MSKQLKFLQLSTALRIGIDPDEIPMSRYDDFLADKEGTAKADMIRSVQAVISGEVKIDFSVSKVTFRRKVFRSRK